MKNVSNYPKLSILVSVYNLEKYITECIESLLLQAYPNTEIIVVDDGSTDGSSNILKEYERQNKIKYIRTENKGLSHARNTSLEAATGDFVTFFDGDDVVHPHTYSTNIPYFIEDSQLDFVCYPILFNWTSDCESILSSSPRVVTDKAEMYRIYMKGDISFSMCDKIFRRTSLQNVKFCLGVQYEDVDTSRQLIESCQKYRISDKGLYYYRRTPSSITTGKMTYKKLSDYFFVTFSFLNSAQKYSENTLCIYEYISRWFRLRFFFLYSDLDSKQKQYVQDQVARISISKIQLLYYFILSKLSLRKFKTLWAISQGDLYQAIVLSNKDT